MDTTFTAEVFEWRGPAPFFWLSLPADACDYVRAEAAEATYGWGAIPVSVRIGGTEWETSLPGPCEPESRIELTLIGDDRRHVHDPTRSLCAVVEARHLAESQDDVTISSGQA